MNNITTNQERENTMSDNMVDANALMDLINKLIEIGDWNNTIEQLIRKDARFVLEAFGRQDHVVIFDSYMEGEKICAIKFIRNLTGMGLIEAKNFVEVNKEDRPPIFTGTLSECHRFFYKVQSNGIPKGLQLKVV